MAAEKAASARIDAKISEIVFFTGTISFFVSAGIAE